MKKFYRTVFISDVHLGSKSPRADKLLEFFDCVDFDNLYLLGDIIDIWALKNRLYWPKHHNDVVKRIIGFANNGKRVVYVPGNHDELFRQYVGGEFSGIQIKDIPEYTSINDVKYLLMHGDMFDVVRQNAKWLMFLGSYLYDVMISMNGGINRGRQLFGLEYWSLSQYVKYKVKRAVSYIGNFEENLAEYAKEMGFHGVICGHIHHAEVRNLFGIQYANCGDWVESCTALVETKKGNLKIYHIK